jgi:hypothetical protein
MRKLSKFICTLSIIIMFSCTKEGATGPAGKDGNANVIYSSWVTSPHPSRDTTIDGTCLKIRHLDVPELTSGTLDSAVILTYMRVGSIGPYTLPYTSDAGGATNTINAIFRNGKIFVYRHTFNTCRFNSGIPESYPGQPVIVNLPQSIEYRYVIIPGSTHLRLAKPLNQMTYDEVCTAYNIPK